MNGIPQPFTEEFIAASLLGFDSIDTYLQTFRYLFPCMSLNSQKIRRCSAGSSSI